MNYSGQSEQQILTGASATKPALGVFCLGLLGVLPVDLLAKPPAVATVIVYLLSGIALAAALRWRMLGEGEIQDVRQVGRQCQSATGNGAGGQRDQAWLAERARCLETITLAPRRTPIKFSHQIWTRADGFTLSGVRSSL